MNTLMENIYKSSQSNGQPIPPAKDIPLFDESDNIVTEKILYSQLSQTSISFPNAISEGNLCK